MSEFNNYFIRASFLPKMTNLAEHRFANRRSGAEESAKNNQDESHLDSLIASAVRPRFSIGALDDLLFDPEIILKQISTKKIAKSRQILNKRYPNYPYRSPESWLNLIRCARNSSSLDFVRFLQLACAWSAVKWYEDMREIVPGSPLDREVFFEHYLHASWWAEVWQSLVMEHGDLLVTFIAFD